MIDNYIGERDVVAFSEVVNKMRQFCLNKGFVEVNTQDRLSILAACEDPTTVATYNYAGEVWPLPQTGQMWLEYELLNRPELPGVFCVSTSYRNEKKPIPGRHKIIFPMFEFELPGTLADLEKFNIELLEYLGFGSRDTYHLKTYDELKKFYGVEELTTPNENQMEKDFGPIVFCKEFPSYTSPFWNMRRKSKDYSEKIDVIMYGNETIGSAERSTNPEEMREEFHTISGGGYAKLLYDLFGKERVEKELDEFLSLKFFPRVGGGIGMTRMIMAVKKLRGEPI
ncbi:MAG TPA: amino acid--tRNA ligase-related protein [Candidatus Paceibacterota bacterium]|jgi:aspartyl/asparaginyl-tRNA synthetase|nr:amino acid--tRNA ligase-related protein [Candidatus Paceibacterota bacterium]